MIGSPAILGSFGQNVAEEARTRGFASLTLVRFAFLGAIVLLRPNAVNSRMYLESPQASSQNCRSARTDPKGCEFLFIAESRGFNTLVERGSIPL